MHGLGQVAGLAFPRPGSASPHFSIGSGGTHGAAGRAVGGSCSAATGILGPGRWCVLLLWRWGAVGWCSRAGSGRLLWRWGGRWGDAAGRAVGGWLLQTIAERQTWGDTNRRRRSRRLQALRRWSTSDVSMRSWSVVIVWQKSDCRAKTRTGRVVIMHASCLESLFGSTTGLKCRGL